MRTAWQRVPLQVWLSLFLCGITLIAFWDIQRHEFINYDDNVYVYNNPIVVGGISENGVRLAFASGKHPLTWLSHMLDWELYERWAGGHHRTNLFFHLANVLLLFAVLRRATGAQWQSAAVAALFAVHPLHVESVAWASERKDVLSTFFWLLCTWSYLHYVEAPRVGRYMLVLLFMLLGLMSKSMLVTLPFTLLLLDYWPLGRLGGNAVRSPSGRVRTSLVFGEKIPLVAMAGLAAVLSYLVQRSGGGTEMLGPLSLSTRITNALAAYASYIHKTFWPTDLIFFYPHPRGSLPEHEVGLAALLLIAVSAFVWFARSQRYLTVGWLWFLGTLLPVIGIVQIGTQAMADRYVYVPHIGLFVAIVWGVAVATSRWPYRVPVLSVAACGLALVLTGMTRHQVAYWHDSVSLSEHAIEVMPDNSVAHHTLGLALYRMGRLDEAIEHYERAIETEPDFADPYVDLASALDDTGRADEAISRLSRALSIRPGHASANYNLGLIQMRRGDVESAIAALRRAIASDPRHGSAHLGLGSLLARQGRLTEAESHFREALRVESQNPAIHVQLGALYAISGRMDEAIRAFETALAIDPQHEQAREMLDLARRNPSKPGG